MVKSTKISNAVIKRLPRYRRYLEDLKSRNVSKISSEEFSRLIGYTASQIRQDLNNFGGFGQQGYGYNVKELYNEISIILGLDKRYRMVLVGAGNLGRAIANYTHFHKAGFVTLGIFDVNPEIIGKQINGVEIKDSCHLKEFVEMKAIDIGIICTTKEPAQEVADDMCLGGIRGIWNFSGTDLETPLEVAVENVHITEGLHTLAYRMNEISRNKIK